MAGKATIDDVVDKSTDDIIQYFQSSRDEDFKTRVKKFEELHGGKHGPTIVAKFGQHAEYIVRGKPSDRKKQPGAYDVAYQKLDSLVEKDTGKLTKEKATNVIEAYVDAFLKAVHSDFDAVIAHAKAEGMDEEGIRELKGNLFGLYHQTERGEFNPLSNDFIKTLAGKTKIEAIESLRSLADDSQKMYTNKLYSKAVEGLLKEEDRLTLAKHIKPKFEKAGFEHDDSHITRGVRQLSLEYRTLLEGKELDKYGYRKVEKEEKT